MTLANKSAQEKMAKAAWVNALKVGFIKQVFTQIGDPNQPVSTKIAVKPAGPGSNRWPGPAGQQADKQQSDR
jgi:hypothetical protein